LGGTFRVYFEKLPIAWPNANFAEHCLAASVAAAPQISRRTTRQRMSIHRAAASIPMQKAQDCYNGHSFQRRPNKR